MSRMEASHVTRKYRSIRNRLLDDSVVFDSTLNKLEKTIKTQQREIQRLEVTLTNHLYPLTIFIITILFYEENQRRGDQVKRQDSISAAEKRNKRN